MSAGIMGIFEEHLSEADFLQSRWEQALRSPRYDLEETAALEERLLAHLDALVLGREPVAEALLKPALEGENLGEIFCAAFASIAESPPAALEAVLALASTAPMAVQAALQRALELSGRTGLEGALLPLLKAPQASMQALALEVLTFRGAVPHGAALELLGHPEGRVVAAALRGLGTSGREMAHRELPRLLGDKRQEVRLVAIETGLLSGARMAWDACRQEAQGRGECAHAAQVLLAVCGEDEDAKRLMALADDEAVRANALWAMGFTGRTLAAEACLELMGQAPPVARLAGEAFSSITGLVLEGVYAVELEEESLPPLEEDLDADLTPRPEDELPVPAREAVADWWHRARPDFSPGTRYLGGKPFSSTVLFKALAEGPMRRRHVHARELALRVQGLHGVQTLSFTARQRLELARAESVRERLPTRPLARTFGS